MVKMPCSPRDCRLSSCLRLFGLSGLRRPESCSHSCRRAQKTLSSSCSDSGGLQRSHFITVHGLHQPPSRVHSLDTAKVGLHSALGCSLVASSR